jgi:hypothetical protein
MPITSWSHSKLVDSDKCKFLLYLKHDLRIPEPERPLPPGKTEHANDRGTRLHQNAEDYVSGKKVLLLPELDKSFGPQLDLLRVLHADKMVSLEGEWGMDENWNIAEWAKAWHRCKLDAMVMWSPFEATVIDYKSGRIFGNEIKHREQMQLYQLDTFLRYPKLETVHTELWYLDHSEVRKQTFTRSQGLRFKSNFDRRGRDITTRTKFPANPNKFSCQWCAYGSWPGGTGHCKQGVKKGYTP